MAGAAGRRAVRPVAGSVEQVVLAVVLGEPRLDPRHEEQPVKITPGIDDARVHEVVDHEPADARVSHGGNRRSDPSRKPMYQSGCEYDVADAGCVRAVQPDRR